MKKKYVTLKNEGCDFRTMARIMTNSGYRMNHATARNQLMLAIESLLTQTSLNLKVKANKEHIKELIANQDLQDTLSDVLYAAYQEMKKEDDRKASKELKN